MTTQPSINSTLLVLKLHSVGYIAVKAVERMKFPPNLIRSPHRIITSILLLKGAFVGVSGLGIWSQCEG